MYKKQRNTKITCNNCTNVCIIKQKTPEKNISQNFCFNLFTRVTHKQTTTLHTHTLSPSLQSIHAERHTFISRSQKSFVYPSLITHNRHLILCACVYLYTLCFFFVSLDFVWFCVSVLHCDLFACCVRACVCACLSFTVHSVYAINVIFNEIVQSVFCHIEEFWTNLKRCKGEVEKMTMMKIPNNPHHTSY